MIGKTNGPRYEVLSPVGIKIAGVAPSASQLGDLNGKTICELDGGEFRANETMPIIRALLKKRYPAARFIEAGTIFSPGSRAQAANIRNKSLADLRAALLQSGCDAVITGNGA